MEIKLDKTTKILLGLIALGLFLNASNVWIKKAYAYDIQKVEICGLSSYRTSYDCAHVRYGELQVGD